jgi:hypothetical protein
MSILQAANSRKYRAFLSAAAIAEYERALELSDDPVVLAFVAHAEAKTGRQNEARQILARLTEAAKTRYDL